MSSDHPFGHLAVDLQRQLLSWSPPDPEQEVRRTAYLKLLGDGPAVMTKAGPPAHITASCLVLSAEGDRVLLTHHRKALLWLQFGGHLEAADADIHAAAAREAGEESGIDGLTVLPEIVELHRHTLAAAFGHCREHFDVRFVAIAPHGAEPVVSDESLDVRWFGIDDLPGETDPDLPDLVAACRRALDMAR